MTNNCCDSVGIQCRLFRCGLLITRFARLTVDDADAISRLDGQRGLAFEWILIPRPGGRQSLLKKRSWSHINVAV
jgi:hypothetical protein